jgi:hypothetical protein
MTGYRVASGGDGLQEEEIAVNMFNKHSRTEDKQCLKGRKPVIHHCKNLASMSQSVSDLVRFSYDVTRAVDVETGMSEVATGQVNLNQ